MLSDFWRKAGDENPITKPVGARIEFYENAIDALHKKVTFYLLKRLELSVEMKEVSKAYRRVGSSERNTTLQESLFSIADGYDEINTKLDTYNRCREQTAMMIEDSRTYLIKPMKDVIADVQNATNNIQKFKKKFPTATDLAPGLEQHLSDATSMMQVSAFLFEKHRIASLRTMSINLLHTELRYHVAAIERISPILEALYLQHAEGEEKQEYNDNPEGHLFGED